MVGKRDSPLTAYGKYVRSAWGALVNIVVLATPVNLALQVGLGKGFFPLYGKPELATGLAVFLSVFVVFALFAGRDTLYSMSTRRLWITFAIFFAGGIGLLVLYMGLRPDYDLGSFLYAGAFLAFTASFHIVALQQFTTNQVGGPQILGGHEAIFREFRRALTEIQDGEVHEVRTIHSFPPDPKVMSEYDSFVTDWLKKNPSCRFTRVVIAQSTPRWKKRLAELEAYLPFKNYREYDFEGPPTLEMFLVDERLVILSFSQQEVEEPTISGAVRLQNPRLCRLLARYHSAHLELPDRRRVPLPPPPEE